MIIQLGGPGQKYQQNPLQLTSSLSCSFCESTFKQPLIPQGHLGQSVKVNKRKLLIFLQNVCASVLRSMQIPGVQVGCSESWVPGSLGSAYPGVCES